MKEDFLQYIWRFSLFSSNELLTTNNERISIIKSGQLNTNSGPDFLNAQLIIDNQKWIGNIEIHQKSSDWYVHHHEKDINYDAVILHVVYEEDVTVFMKNNQPIPTLVLKDRISETLLDSYHQLLNNPKAWIPCASQISTVDGFVMNSWLERLFIERLEEKSLLIKEMLVESKNDYEVVLFQLLAKNFGLKVNADAFLRLAKTIDFSIFRKEWFDEQRLSALLFGIAGFLEEDIEELYYKELKSEYEYLKKKYQLKSLGKNDFQFFRMRPNNFPTIRLAQLSALYVKHQNLFSKLIEVTSLSQFYTIFDEVEIHEFWNSHYTFKKSSKKTSKRFSKSFINLLIINTIIPLKFTYEKEKRGNINTEDLAYLLEVPAEKNNIINKFNEYKVKAKNALETQALLQLKNKYCDSKNCLQCSVGDHLLKT